MNPYNWKKNKPEVEIRRGEVPRLAAALCQGDGIVVLGGRGMGKSVFLRQLNGELERRGEAVRVVLFNTPPPRLTVDACLETLAARLGVAVARDSTEILTSYLDGAGAPQRLILLFDEFDRYAQGADRGLVDPPGRGFFNDLEAARRELDGVGILAAGSIGVFVFRDVLGSSFLSRAEQVRLGPFARSELDELARPFVAAGRPLDEETLDALHLGSGGIPALATYGLQSLWELPSPVERDVAEVLVGFQERHGGYLDDVERAFSDPRLSRAPHEILERIRQNPGNLDRDDLAEVCKLADDALDLKVADVLGLLAAAGLVRIEGSVYRDNPVPAYPIPSLLNLPTAAPRTDGFREDFRRDLEMLLARLHRASVDFFRSGSNGKVLVPESVFAAHLALGFELLGWICEREAGRTDLKLRRNARRDVAVVEVKIWGRAGYREAHQQVESYWTDQVKVGAVVQLTDAELPDWPETYRRECLDRPGITTEATPVDDPRLRARFACTSMTPDGLPVAIDHLLLRLARRF